MDGIITLLSEDTNSGRHYGVVFEGGSGQIFPVPDREFDIRDLKPGTKVEFSTDRETGQAHIQFPEPVRGIRQEQQLP